MVFPKPESHYVTRRNSPIIETMINTFAMGAFFTGATFIYNRDYYGFLVVWTGAMLEFLKYYGRRVKLW